MSVCSRLFTVFMSAENLEGRTHTVRPYGLSKPEIARISFKSLWLALNQSYLPSWRLVASDNSSSEEFRAWMHKHSRAHLAPDGVPIYPTPSYEQREQEIQRILGLEAATDDQWLLLAEDDQLWSGDALYLLRDFIETYSGDYVLVPYIQPYLIWAGLTEHQSGPEIESREVLSMDFLRAREKPRLWARSRLHHWMQVFWTNGTLLIRVGLLRKWWAENPGKSVLEHHFMEKKAETVPFFAPIPSLSTHFQEGCESPGFNQRVTEEWVRSFLRHD